MTAFKLLMSIVQARSKGLLRLRKADKPIRLDCIGGECGLCCEVLGKGVTVTQVEAGRFKPEELQQFGNRYVLQSDRNGCCFLKNRSCTRYDDRPQGCREYPWYQVYGELYYDSGCPGIKFDKDERPLPGLIVPFRNYLPKPEGWFTRFIKFWVTH